MNEQLQKALIEILNSALSAKDFILSEMPDVINQLLSWKLLEHLIYFSIGCLFLIFVFCLWIVVVKQWENIEASNNEDLVVVCSVMATFICLIIGPIVIFANLGWIQILVAPKVYLIEYAAQLAK